MTVRRHRRRMIWAVAGMVAAFAGQFVARRCGWDAAHVAFGVAWAACFATWAYSAYKDWKETE